MVLSRSRPVLQCMSLLFVVVCCVRWEVCLADDDFLFAASFDVDVAAAFFVSPDGLDTNPGSAALPFQTITKGIAAAAADATNKTVVVAGGIYDESVTLANGVSVFGGYQTGSWVRDPGNFTIIAGVSSAGIHDRTVIASGITSATTLDGFVIFGPVNDKTGGNSYAIYVTGSNANLHIMNNLIFGGHAGPGANGAAGLDGSTGVGGSGRNPNLAVADLAYDAEDAAGTGECNTSNDRQYTNGGALSCGGTPVNGGDGGGNQCPVMSFCDTGGTAGCLTFHWNEFTAIDGAAGAAGGTNGGVGGVGAFAGDDMIQVFATAFNSYVCYLPTDTDGDGNNTFGLDGVGGGDGGNGAGVIGCAAAVGAVVGGNWVGGAALTGNAGGNGGGGGGGGAGGGGKCQATTGHTGCTDGGGKDTLGGHGGGGGSGGCGGAGGMGGGAGGGAFGIFIVGSGTAPVVTGNTLFGGSGGLGGLGGNGGSGGIGGAGALGGSTGVPSLFCADVGGRGGGGGNGGYGAGGGGGCGGASFGIYTSGVGSPNYCQPAANNTINDGSAGAGGGGGLSLVNSAGAGQNGVLADCSFH